MKKVCYTLLGIAILGNVYATVRAVRSYSKFNKAVKSVNCRELRKEVQHLTEAIKLREV